MVPKRKAPPTTSHAIKKVKKQTVVAPASSKPKTVTKKEVTKKISTVAPAPASKSRKKAADFYSSESEDEGWEGIKDAPTTTKTKKPASSKGAPAAEVTKTKDAKKKKPSKKITTPSDSEDSDAENAEDAEEIKLDASIVAEESDSDSSEDEAADDHAAMILKGFESSDEEETDGGKPVDGKQLAKTKIPNDKKVKKKLDGLKNKEKTTPGIIYLGRVPHGFYEHEMRSYFSQFGQVLRLRLSRNKKTGASRHYAFIEFADQEVADIAAETMHNYLLFGHILKCKPVPRDNLEYIESLFKGANKRFIPKPAAKIAKYQHDRKRTAEEWDAKVKKENKKRKDLSEKLKKSGIGYEFEAPEVGKPEPMEVDEVV